MDRRKNERNARRLGVRFWQKGEAKERLGHTLNVSGSGMFVGTDRPPPSGTRVRVEITDPDVGFVVEGVVAHSHRVAPELRKIREPGMGVRFLPHEELVQPLVQRMTKAHGGGGGVGVGNGQGGEAPTAASAPYAVRFDTSWQFLRVLEQDIRHGGLFVATSRPARLNEIIPIELHVPGLEKAIRVSARVVHCFDPATTAGTGGSDRPAGMGVEFTRLEETLQRLEQEAERLRG